ncbi:MAG TPA: hypothetical protein QF873_02675 [Patescibacteria group bacterium]|nr:hypothetical protein [Patescibacteria group bacterium]
MEERFLVYGDSEMEGFVFAALAAVMRSSRNPEGRVSTQFMMWVLKRSGKADIVPRELVVLVLQKLETECLVTRFEGAVAGQPNDFNACKLAGRLREGEALFSLRTDENSNDLCASDKQVVEALLSRGGAPLLQGFRAWYMTVFGGDLRGADLDRLKMRLTILGYIVDVEKGAALVPLGRFWAPVPKHMDAMDLDVMERAGPRVRGSATRSEPIGDLVEELGAMLPDIVPGASDADLQTVQEGLERVAGAQ